MGMIRNATIEDIPKLQRLKTTVGRDAYYHYGSPDQFQAWEEGVCSEEYFESMINNHSIILVAEYDTAFLGMAAVTFYDNSALFGNLYVGLQNRGIGSLLTQHRLLLVENHIALQHPQDTFEVRARCFYQNWKAYKHILKHGFLPAGWEFNEYYKNNPMVLFSQTRSHPEFNGSVVSFNL